MILICRVLIEIGGSKGQGSAYTDEPRGVSLLVSMQRHVKCRVTKLQVNTLCDTIGNVLLVMIQVVRGRPVLLG